MAEGKTSNTKEVDQKFKALEYLLNQSKLYATIILDQIKRKSEQESQANPPDDAISHDRSAAQAGPEPTQEDALQDDATMNNQTKAVTVRRSARAAARTASAPTGDHTTVSVKKRTRTTKGQRLASGPSLIPDYFRKKASEKAGTDVSSSLLDHSAGRSTMQSHAPHTVESTAEHGQPNRPSSQPSVRQPGLVTGGIMRDYQLDGLEWLASLYENGLNGILADEMGLGKTIQTIAFLAFLWERKSYGPFLIVAPLSTTSNWVTEVGKWASELPVVLYHGSKADRTRIGHDRFQQPGTAKFPIVVTSYEICMKDRAFLASFAWQFIIIDEGHRLKNLNCRLIRDLQSFTSANRLLITGTPLQNNLSELWSLLHFLMPAIFDSLDAFESWFDFDVGAPDLDTADDQSLARKVLSQERQERLVDSLHAILRPFLLRRLKSDVELEMPKKREYVFYVGLTDLQRKLYTAIQTGTIRQTIEQQAIESVFGPDVPGEAPEPDGLSPSLMAKKRKREDDSESDDNAHSRRRSRRLVKKPTKSSTPSSPLSNQTGLFSQIPSRPASLSTKFPTELIQTARTVVKKFVISKKLQNPVMQLRLCCDSPLNFFNPFDISAAIEDVLLSSGMSEKKVESIVNKANLPFTPDERLVTTSGKMRLLDQLLTTIIPQGHKVLIFSQFTTQLDIIETYAADLRGWGVCRIDGSVSQPDRHALITAFNKRDDEANVDGEPVKTIFLLSTRSGGQGITLTAADTVILFDSDWNPQQDLQAQDRAHRIGQTKNVLVFRFASTLTTVDQDGQLDGLNEFIEGDKTSPTTESGIDSHPQSPITTAVMNDQAVMAPISPTHSSTPAWKKRKYQTTTSSVEQTLLNQASTKRRLEMLVIKKGGLTRSMALQVDEGAISEKENADSRDRRPVSDKDGRLAFITPPQSRCGKVRMGDDGNGCGSSTPLSLAQLNTVLDRSEEAYESHSRLVEHTGRSQSQKGPMGGLLSHSAIGAVAVTCQPLGVD